MTGRITEFVIYGAGGIGCVVGARLGESGYNVKLIARGEHAQRMREQGLRLVSARGVEQHAVQVYEHPGDLDFSEETAVLLCMKSQHTEDALRTLALEPGSSDAALVCMQNGVANERVALRYFSRVYASVVILPALFINPGEVVTHATGAGGILDTGCYPAGVDATATEITSALSHAGFSSRPDARVMRQKYAKLLSNLNNILAAGLSDFENTSDIRRQMRTEALDCYAAAGIDCASRDETSERRQGVMQMVDIPGHPRVAGSSWQSVVRGTGDIETEFLNGEISMLGRFHDVPTPVNDACVALAREMVRKETGPGFLDTRAFSKRLSNTSG